MRGEIRQHPVYRDTEWQAHAWAGAVLAPARGLRELEKRGELNRAAVKQGFGMSGEAADIRMEVYRTKKHQLLN